MVEIHPNLKQLSDSSIRLLHSCNRRFELDKLSERKIDEDGDFHLDFGKLVGYGVQEYFETGDLNSTYFKMYTAWENLIDDETGKEKKKTFWFALHAIDKFVGVRKGQFSNCDVATINGRSAKELGFSIDLGDGFYYRGFVDLVLLNKMRRELLVLENKTTGFRTPHEATYENSAQALGYSLVLDQIVPLMDIPLNSSFKVYYPVYSSVAMEWNVFDFSKSHTSRALWIKNILLDKQHIMERAEEGYFPMYGESCYAFFRPCPHFGICNMSNKVLIGKDIINRFEPEEKYDFHFNLMDIIAQQLARVEG